jgi:hypothetical protein
VPLLEASSSKDSIFDGSAWLPFDRGDAWRTLRDRPRSAASASSGPSTVPLLEPSSSKDSIFDGSALATVAVYVYVYDHVYGADQLKIRDRLSVS